MKNFQITARKILMFLSILVAFIPCTLLLTACGGNSDNQMPEKQFSWAECSIANNGDYVVIDDYQISISNNVDIHDIISMKNFIVTLHYTDDSTEVITSGYTFEILEIESDYYPYSIEVKYQGNTIGTFSVTIDNGALPLFVNIEALGDMYSGYRCTEELRYTGEEYDITQIIKTSDNVTLAQMINDNMVTVDTEIYGDESGAIRATEPNVCYGSEYGTYGFNLHATTGYKWFINGQTVDNIEVLWTIKRAIIETPKLTSGTSFIYQHQWDESTQEYVGVEQGLTFDYGDGAEYIEPAEKHADAGWYQTILNIKNEYENRYAFLVNGAEQTYLNYDWSIEAMRLAEPTMISENNDNHFIYTGENIFPTLTSDYLALFAVVYPESAVDVRNWGAYQINVALKSEYDNIYTSNYNFQGTTLDYYIDPAPFPTDILADIEDVDFIIKKSYGPNSNYADYIHTMSTDVETLSNDAVDIAKLQYNENSSISYLFPDNLNGLTTESTLNAGTYEDAVKVAYKYDQNHETCEFNATLEILPVGIEINDDWRFWINQPGRSTSVNDGEVLTYSDDTTYLCYISDFNNDIQITYTNNYGVDENNYTTTKDTIQDAGYYQIVANITPKNGTINYFVYLSSDTNKTPISTLTYGDVIHINKKTIYDYPYINETYSSYDIDFYETADTSRSLAITSFSDIANEIVNNAVDLDSISQTTYYSADGNNYSVALNTIDAGYYKTIFTWQLLDDYVLNYALENGRLEKEWRIYPNVYELQTTNANEPNYIGWSNNDFTFYYREERNYPIITPDGISAHYMFDNNPSYRDGTWHKSGSSSSTEDSDLGDYLTYAIFKLNNIPGVDGVTVTVDGNEKTVANDCTFNTTSDWVHFEVIERTPETLALGTEQTLTRENYKYFKFTTTSTENEKYLVLVNIGELDINIRLESADPKTDVMAYSSLANRTDWDRLTYYYTLADLSANTTYVLRVGSWSGAYEDMNPYIKVIVAPKQLEFTYRDDIPVPPNYPTSSEIFEGFVVAQTSTDVGTTVTVPNSYVKEDNSTAYAVRGIAADGFKNNTTMTTIYLPGQIVNIGDNAFAGCTNLTDIYFESAYGNWNELIIFGENVFDGCGTITLHCDGSTYTLDSNGKIVF